MSPIGFGLYLDIALICLALLAVFVCVRKGFTRLVLTLIAAAAAVFVAMLGTQLLAGPVSDAATPAMERFIVHQGTRLLPDEDALDTIVSMSDKVVTVVRAVLVRMGGEDTGEEAEEEDTEPLTQMAHGLAVGFYSFLIFIVLFSLVFSVLRMLVERIEPARVLPFVGITDRVLGLLVGLALGVVVLFLPVILLKTVVPKLLHGALNVPEDVFSVSALLRLTHSLYPY